MSHNTVGWAGTFKQRRQFQPSHKSSRPPVVQSAGVDMVRVCSQLAEVCSDVCDGGVVGQDVRYCG